MREIRCELRFEADADRRGPGRLRGVLLREGEPARTLPEEFARGALTWPDDGVVLNEQHNRQAPIVRFTPERVGDEIRVDVELPDTSAAGTRRRWSATAR